MKRVIKKIALRILSDAYFDLLWWWYLLRPTAAPRDVGKPTVVLIDHMFQQDIEALERANSLFSFVTISAKAFRVAADQLFPSAVESYAIFNSSGIQPIR